MSCRSVVRLEGALPGCILCKSGRQRQATDQAEEGNDEIEKREARRAPARERNTAIGEYSDALGRITEQARIWARDDRLQEVCAHDNRENQNKAGTHQHIADDQLMHLRQTARHG